MDKTSGESECKLGKGGLHHVYNIYMAVLGLHCCTQDFSSCGELEATL